MARIVVQAVHADGELRRWTLSERIVAKNLDSDHYVAQLLERLTWAAADAEALSRDQLTSPTTRMALPGTIDRQSGRAARVRVPSPPADE